MLRNWVSSFPLLLLLVCIKTPHLLNIHLAKFEIVLFPFFKNLFFYMLLKTSAKKIDYRIIQIMLKA